MEIGTAVVLGTNEDYYDNNPVMIVLAYKAKDEEVCCGWFTSGRKYKKAWFPEAALNQLDVEEEDEEAEEAEAEEEEGTTE